LAGYREALEAFEMIAGEEGIVEAHFGLGEVCRLQGQFDESLRHYQDSMKKAQQSGNQERIAYAAWGIGEIHRLAERYGPAVESHQLGLKLCQQVGDRRSEGWAYLGLAETQRMRMRWELARACCQDALRLFEKTGSGTEIGHAKLVFAEIARCTGHANMTLYHEAELEYRPRKLVHCVVLLSIGKALALSAATESQSSISTLLDEADAICDQFGLRVESARISEVRNGPGSLMINPLNFP
jgi:tetratricopeptide (TPR) repeat protein